MQNLPPISVISIYKKSFLYIENHINQGQILHFLRKMMLKSQVLSESSKKYEDVAGPTLKVGFSLFFCDFQWENAETAPFFVHFTKK